MFQFLLYLLNKKKLRKFQNDIYSFQSYYFIAFKYFLKRFILDSFDFVQILWRQEDIISYDNRLESPIVKYIKLYSVNDCCWERKIADQWVCISYQILPIFFTIDELILSYIIGSIRKFVIIKIECKVSLMIVWNLYPIFEYLTMNFKFNYNRGVEFSFKQFPLKFQ